MDIESWDSIFYGSPDREGTRWPAGKYWIGHDKLGQLLAMSARHHARQAVTLFTSEDQTEVIQSAISTGCAVELLAKAYLASIEPGLLADRSERDAVLLLANKGHLASSGHIDIKSISASEALKLVKHFHPSFPYNPQADSLVLKVRNAAAHMALVSHKELFVAVVLMCRIIEGIIPVLQLDRESFWGEHALSTVKELLDRDSDERRQIVTAKMVAARHRVSSLLANLDEAGRVVVLNALSGRKGSLSDYEEPQSCPVCTQQGWLLCAVELGTHEAVVSKGGSVCSTAEAVAYPVYFECPVCELQLEEDELLEVEEFPKEIKLEFDLECDDEFYPDEG